MGDWSEAKMIQIDKRILGRGAALLLKGILKSVKTEKRRYLAAVTVSAEVIDGVVVAKTANITLNTDSILECPCESVDDSLVDETTVKSDIFVTIDGLED
jgi:hypothetical protein